MVTPMHRSQYALCRLSINTLFLILILQEDRQPFLGQFILEMFATHLKKTIASVEGYGHAVGGLAMAVGAVCDVSTPSLVPIV